jgi:lysyl oxidase
LSRVLVRLIPALLAIGVMVPAALAIDKGPPPPGDALLPDLDQETPSGLILTRTRAEGWRLGFRSAVRNVGDGPLIIDGRRPGPGVKRMDASQTLVHAHGPRTMIPRAGHLRYVRSPDHQHWHLLGFDRYELRRPGGGAVVRDRKSGFCLGDRYEVTTRALPAKAPEKVYRSRCGLSRPELFGIREGISVGYGDDYDANLEGQYLPLRKLRSGRYVLVHEVNADRKLHETSYANNSASLLLRYRRGHRGDVPSIRILAVCPDTAACPSGP